MMVDHTEQLTRMETKLDTMLSRVEDHENRLRTNERVAWWGSGAGTLMTAILATVLYRLR